MVWVCSAAFLLLLVLGSQNRLELRAMAAGPELALRLRLELLDGWIQLPIVWTLRLEGDGHRARLYVLGKERSFPRGKRGAKPWMKRFGRQLLRRCRVRELSSCLLLGFAGDDGQGLRRVSPGRLHPRRPAPRKEPELTSQGFGHAKLQGLGVFLPAFLHDRRFHWA